MGEPDSQTHRGRMLALLAAATVLAAMAVYGLVEAAADWSEIQELQREAVPAAWGGCGFSLLPPRLDERGVGVWGDPCAGFQETQRMFLAIAALHCTLLLSAVVLPLSSRRGTGPRAAWTAATLLGLAAPLAYGLWCFSVSTAARVHVAYIVVPMPNEQRSFMELLVATVGTAGSSGPGSS